MCDKSGETRGAAKCLDIAKIEVKLSLYLFPNRQHCAAWNRAQLSERLQARPGHAIYVTHLYTSYTQTA